MTAVVVAAGPQPPDAVPEGAEVILVRQGGGATDPRFGTTLDVFPAGVGYAWNRGLALVTAPRVAFLDASARSSEPIVFPREALLRAGGFDLSLGDLPGPAFELDAALRLGLRPPLARRRVGRGLGRVARRHRSPGLLVGAHPRELVRALRPAPATAPIGALEHAPRGLTDRPLKPLPLRHKAKTQYLYRAGDDALLHVYLDPSAALGRSLAEREEIRRRTNAGGIPRVLASAEGLDSLWVLEELLAGDAPEGATAGDWLPLVLAWAVSFALPHGPPLSESDRWRDHREELLRESPGHLRDAVERAALVLEQLPSVHMHGDLQRSNVVVAGHAVGAVDWEGAWLHGIPGLDLVFLALLAGDAPPAPETVAKIAAGELLGAELERVGVGRDVVPAALLVHLASWSASERRRLARLGAPPREPVFGPLLEAVGPRLAGQASGGGRRTTAGRLR